jgi:hypothetical protein
MANTTLKSLEAAKARIAAKIAAIEKSISSQRTKELALLPAKHGFADVKSFLRAVKAAAGDGQVSGKKRRTRAVITDATRAEVKKQVEAGKTGAAIAKSLGISLPSVQNIKKALGLVTPRKKK